MFYFFAFLFSSASALICPPGQSCLRDAQCIPCAPGYYCPNSTTCSNSSNAGLLSCSSLFRSSINASALGFTACGQCLLNHSTLVADVGNSTVPCLADVSICPERTWSNADHTCPPSRTGSICYLACKAFVLQKYGWKTQLPYRSMICHRSGTWVDRNEFDPGCASCPDGHYMRQASSNATKQCLPCPAGSAPDAHGRCAFCPVGTFAANAASATCAPCPTCNRIGVTSQTDLYPESSLEQTYEPPVHADSPTIQLGYLFIIGVAGVLGGFLVIWPWLSRWYGFIALFAGLIATPHDMRAYDTNTNVRVVAAEPQRLHAFLGVVATLGGLALAGFVTAQFARDRVMTLTTLLPGTRYSNGDSTLSMPLVFDVKLRMPLPVTCDTALSVMAQNERGRYAAFEDNGTLALGCHQESSVAVFSLSIRSMHLYEQQQSYLVLRTSDEDYLFASWVAYEVNGSTSTGARFRVSEIVTVNDPTLIYDSCKVVRFTAVPVETMDTDAITAVPFGYDLTYSASDPTEASRDMRGTTGMAFAFEVPSLLSQTRSVVAISNSAFLTSFIGLPVSFLGFINLVALLLHKLARCHTTPNTASGMELAVSDGVKNCVAQMV